MCNLILSHLTYTHQLGKHSAKATFTNVHTAFSQPSDGCMLCSLSLPFQSYVLRIADTGNAAMVILTGLLMVTALLPALYANNSCAHFIILVFLFTTVTSKCLVSINEFACAMGGDLCCTCFTGGETETHTRSWHHTVGWAVQSGLELKTCKTCCHMFRELERKQLKLWALSTSVCPLSGVQKPGRHFHAPAASPWPWRGSGLPAQLTSTAQL